jgi:uncharacterized Zn-binding protein involved in type VI secretion
MPQTHVIGDVNDAGGAVTSTPQSTFFINGKLASVDGSIGTSHLDCPAIPIHCAGAWVTANGDPTFLIEGIPINVLGDADTCGHARAAGQANFLVG